MDPLPTPTTSKKMTAVPTKNGKHLTMTFFKTVFYREVERSTVECLHFNLSSLIGEDKRKLGEMEKPVIHVLSCQRKKLETI